MGAHSLRSAVFALGLVAALAGVSRAELIYLKDGNVVAGKIVGATEDSFEVELAGGKTTLKKGAISRVEYEPSASTAMPERGQERPATLSRGERVLMAGLGGGIPLKSQGFSRDAKADLAGQVEYFEQVDPRWGIGVSLDAPGFATNYPSDDQFTRKSEVTAAGLELLARFVALPESRVSPIVEAGAGLDSYYQLIETTNKATGQFTETHDAVSGLAAVAGAGAQILFHQRGIAQLEARWLYLQADKNKFGVDGAQAVSLVASVGCRF